MLSFKDILVHCDSRAETHPALDRAVAIALANGSHLKIIDMVPELGWPTGQAEHAREAVVDTISKSKAQRLQEIAGPLREQGLAVDVAVLQGKTSVALIREVLREGHDLVVRAAKGTDSRRAGFFGTTATRLFRKCPCPVLIQKAEPTPGGRVVAAVAATSDDELHDELNRQIIGLARDAAAPSAPDIVSAWSIYGASVLKSHMRPSEFEELHERTKRNAGNMLDRLLKDFGSSIEDDTTHLLEGDPEAVLLDYVGKTETDLLVMGTIARSGVAGILMGNTAEQVLDRVECSVLAVKPKGFESPIRPS